MFNLFRKAIAVLTIFCLLMSSMPVDGYVQFIGAVAEGLSDMQNTVSAGYSFNWVLTEAETQRDKVRTENGWQYVQLESKPYAVIIGYDNTGVQTLSVPDRISGLDVVGLADGALWEHTELRQIALPGNLYAIGNGALRSGVTISGYNGSYAQRYAREKRYSFLRLGKYDFRDGVVDYADIRQDRFTRYSEKELDVGALEAERLSAGTVFMLIDPENAYQISYYSVVSISDAGEAGFVHVKCETPEIGKVFKKVSGHDEIMALDMDTFTTSSDVVLVSRGEEDKKGFSYDGITISFDPIKKEVKAGLSVSTKLGSGELKISGEEAFVTKADYSGGMYEDSTGKTKTTMTGSLTVTYENEAYKSLSQAEGGMTAQSFDSGKPIPWQSGDHNPKQDAAYQRSLKNYQKQIAKVLDSGNQLTTGYAKYPLKLGNGVLLTYGGIFSATVQFGILLKINGSGTVKLSGTYVVYLGGSSDGSVCQDRGREDIEVTAEGAISVKAGFQLDASLYIGPVCIVQGIVFAGVKGTAEFSFSSNLLTDYFNNLANNTVPAYRTSLNNMDCIEIKVNVLVEITVKAGLIKVIGVDVGDALTAGHTFEVVNEPIFDCHFHLLPYEFSPEGYYDESRPKDKYHNADVCPYGRASAVFKLDPEVDSESAVWDEYKPLDENQYIPEPDTPLENDPIRHFAGWYTDDSFSEDSRISEWPYQIKAIENKFYAKIRKDGWVNVIRANGVPFTEAFLCTGGTTFTLPEVMNFVKWVLVNPDRDYLVLEEMQPDQNGKYSMNEEGDDITVVAVQTDTVRINFTESYGGHTYPLGYRYALPCTYVEEPYFEYRPQYYWYGWFYNGEEITGFPWEVPENVQGTVNLSLVWMTEEEYDNAHPNESKTTYTYTGTAPALSTFYYEYNDGNGTAKVTGFDGRRERSVWNSQKERYETEVYYVDPVNLSVPSSTSRTVKDENGNDVTVHYTVTAISGGALRSLQSHDTNEYTLRSVYVPSSVTTIESGAFSGNPFLGKISGLEGIDAIPSSFAKNCHSLVEVELSGFTSIGDNAFENCISLYAVTVGGDIGNSSFAGCTSLHDVKMTGTKYIGNNAFSGDTELENVKFSTVLYRVGSYAFNNCSKLKELKFPATVATYGNNMINGCEGLHFLIADGAGVGTASSSSFTIGSKNGLREIRIGEGVTKIAESAFSNGNNGFSKVMTLQLPVTLTHIGKKAFYKCGMLTLTLPLSLEKIEASAFEGCSHLTKLNIDGNNLELGAKFVADCPRVEEINILPGVASLGANAFTNTTAKLVTINGLKTIGASAFENSKVEKIVIEEGTERIEESAFCSSHRLKTLVFPSTITYYGRKMIYSCEALEELTAGGSGLGADEKENGDHQYDPFSIGSNSLRKLTILEGTTKIGNYKFLNSGYGYNQLETVVFPESLTEIGKLAFYQSGILKLHIPSTISKIGEKAFAYSKRMTDLTVDGNGLTIPTECFTGNTALKTVHIGRGVRIIGESAFQSCGAEEIVIEEGVQQIGYAAFCSCQNLKTLVFPSTITYYGRKMIYNCEALEDLTAGGSGLGADEKDNGEHQYDPFSIGSNSLRKLTILEGTTKIGNYKFLNYGYGYNQLETVVFPESLTEIGKLAFYQSGILNLHIPSTISKIGEKAFAYNTRMTDLKVDGNGLTIPTSCFTGNTALKTVYIGGGVRIIGESAFQSCGAEKIVIFEGVEQIGYAAFYGCRNLKTLVFPSTITYYGRKMIYDCEALEELTAGGSGLEADEKDNGDHQYDPFSIGSNSLRKLTILEGTTKIGNDKFMNAGYGHKQLETVVFPESLTEIGKYAFYQSGILNLHIPSTISTIGEKAFAYSTRMTDLTVDGNDLTIPTSCFTGNTALKTVHIGGGVRIIGESAFQSCGAENIVIDEGVQQIGYAAFYGCRNLKKLVFPSTITYYGRKMIYDCEALEELTAGGSGLGADENANGDHQFDPFQIGSSALRKLTILEGTTKIGYYKFSGHNQLETVVFPESLTEIGKYAFNNAKGLSSVRIPSNCTSIDSAAFQQCRNLLMFTDAYNAYVEQYANAHSSQGFTYEIMNPENYPFVNMTYVYPDEEEVVRPVRFLSRIEPIEPKAIPGLSFAGWYWDAAFTRPLAGTDRMQMAAGTLYARYVSQLQAVYAVKVPVGRTLPSQGDEEVYHLPQKYITWAILPHTEGEMIRSPETVPALDGWNFTGWYTDPEMTSSFGGGQMPEDGMILYGGFTAAGLGGSYNWGEYGYTLTNYHLTEQDGENIDIPNMNGGHVVEAIGYNVFSNSGLAKSVKIPAGVTYIHPEAFGMLPNLERIEVDARNETFTSRDGILYSKDLTILYRCPMNWLGQSVHIPGSVRTISPYAFAYCKNIRTVNFPNGLESIGNKAFAGCTALTRVSLPESTSYLGEYAFVNCTSMTEFSAQALGIIGKYALPNNIFMSVRGPIGEGVLRDYCMDEQNGMSKNYNIRYVTVLQDNEIATVIGAEAGMPLMEDAVISEAESTHVRRLYEDSEGTIVWPVDEVVPDEDIYLYAILEPVFTTESCSIEKDGNLYAGVRITGYNGTGGEVILPKIMYGETLLAIGANAFAGAQSPVTSLYLPGSILEMDDHALETLNGDRYEGILLTDENTYVSRWAEANGYTAARAVYELSFDTNGGAAIQTMQMTGGGTIRLPEAVRTGCQFDGWFLDEDCSEPVGLNENGFFTMPLYPVLLHALWSSLEEVPFRFEENDGGIRLTGYEGTDALVTVPDTLNGLPVTQIADKAFQGKTGITRITLPDSVIEIGNLAFADCPDLNSVYLGQSVETTGKGAFRDTPALTGIEVAASNSFFRSENGILLSADGQILVAVPANVPLSEIPSSVREIAAYAMYGNTQTTELSIPGTVELIGVRAFAEQPYLTALDFEDAVCEIPACAASGCGSLESVTVGDGVLSIGSYAFQYARALEEIHISENVQHIDDSMLAGAPMTAVVYGEKGSEAYRYAQDANRLFVDPDIPAVESLEIVSDTDVVAMGETLNLTVNVEPETQTEIRWSSSVESVALVENGTVQGLARGLTWITARADNGVSASLLLTVRGVPAQEITILNAPESLEVGESLMLSARILPVEAEDDAPAWTVSDELRVDENGVITGIQDGEGWIEASTVSGEKDRRAIQVYVPVNGISLPEEQQEMNLTLIPGRETALLTAVVEPEDATIRTLQYRSSDTNVVQVDENGLIQAKGFGDATITIGTDWTHGREMLTAEITVHVVPVGIDVPVLTYTGPVWRDEPVTIPEMTFVYDDYELRPGTDYRVAVAEPTEETPHLVTVTGLGYFNGTRTEAFTVYDKPVASVSCDALPLTVGQRVKPVIQLHFDDDVPTDIQAGCVLRMESSDESVIEVLEDGTLTAKAAGTAVVTPVSSIPLNEDVQIQVIVEERASWRTLMLPDFLKEIGSEAFLGTAADRIVMGSQLKTIQANAFQGMNNLKQIELHAAGITQSALNVLKQTDAIILIPDDMVQLQTLLEEKSIPYALMEE